MRSMPRTHAFVALLAIACISGCVVSDAGGCFRPIDEFVTAGRPADGSGGGSSGGGQCAAWIKIAEGDGAWFRDMRAEGWRFDVDEGALDLVDQATAATALVSGVTSASVWSVRGLDPDDVLAMHSAPDGEYFLLVREGAHFRIDVDATMCRHATGLAHTLQERCAPDASPETAPSA